jgi:hypothetical protein
MCSLSRSARIIARIRLYDFLSRNVESPGRSPHMLIEYMSSGHPQPYCAIAHGLNVHPLAADIIKGPLDSHRLEIDGDCVREDTIVRSPGSGYDDQHALTLAEEGGVLVEQRQDRFAALRG